MKEEIFEKVVEYEKFEWQKRSNIMKFEDYLLMITSFFMGIWLYSFFILIASLTDFEWNKYIFFICAIIILIIILITQIKKKKVYYRRVK